MHPVYLLAFVTLVVILAFGFWQLQSVRRSKAVRGEASGTPLTMAPPNDAAQVGSAGKRPASRP